MRSPKLILILFLLLGSIYAITTPIFEASDELWHYPFVRHLADGNPLPVQDPDNVGPWKQEASQQPLYYALAAALTFWIDTADMESVRWLNPHVDNGVLTNDGNINLIVHRPEKEAFPWQGTILAVRLIRLASVLLGACTVYLTWRIGRIVFPSRPELALGAAAVNAFTPMFLFISGAVNNDNLAVALSSCALFLMLRDSVRSRNGSEPNMKSSLLLGIVLGLGALTKTTALGLVPLAFLVLLVSTWHHLSRRAWQQWISMIIRNGLMIVLPVLLIAGWWYLRNYRLYGDWLGWSAFIQTLGQRAHPASPLQLWGERWGFSLSYWGLFGGINVPMPEWIYQVLNATAALSIVGLALFLGRSLMDTRNDDGSRTMRLLPLGLLSLWIFGVLIGLVRWATITWSSQGRLVFPAISAISILLVAGLFGWLPGRTDRPWHQWPSSWGVALLGGFMFLVSAAAPFAWIGPAYQPPAAPNESQLSVIQNPLRVELGGRMRLLGYDLAETRIKPGDQLRLTLYWETLAPMERDWSVFVHLNDSLLGAPIAQRDMYPGQGLQATRLLAPGQRLVCHYVIQIPETVYAPAKTELVVGLYDFQSSDRLSVQMPSGATPGDQDAIFLGAIDLYPSSAGEYPNPALHNFGDQLALVGYDMEPRRLLPGETLILTLYWQALAEMDVDYTIFTHLRDLDDPSNRIFAQHDAEPPGGTSTWTQGQIVKSVYQLTLAADTPAAVHEIEVGVYHQTAEGAFSRLQLITPGGRLVDDFLVLSKVRVD